MATNLGLQMDIQLFEWLGSLNRNPYQIYKDGFGFTSTNVSAMDQSSFASMATIVAIIFHIW